MSTFSQMTAQIADDLQRTDLTTQIKSAINRALIYYQKEHFWFNETSGTFSTVASQESYGTSDNIPSTIKEIFRLEVTISSANYQVLIPRTFDYIREMNRGAATGVPTDYAWYQSKIYLALIPNAVKTITVYYDKNYAALSADADTNDFTAYAEDLIESRSMWWIYKFTLRDEKKAEEIKEVELDVLNSLRIKTRQLTATNKVTPTDF